MRGGQALLRFDTLGGSEIRAKFHDSRINFCSELGEFPTPTRSGYVFQGWYTAEFGGKRATPDAKFSEPVVTLYARWRNSSPEYTVRFHRMASSDDETTVEAGLPCGESTRIPDVVSSVDWRCSGCSFCGWAKSAGATVASYANGAEVRDLAAAGETVDLYAVWRPKNSYEIVFRRNESGIDTVFTRQWASCGQTARLAWKDSQLGWANPPGKAFLGWAMSANATVAKYANGESVRDLVVDGGMANLYAVWCPSNTYVVTFHRNVPGGDTVEANQWISCGASTTLAWKDSQLGWAPEGYAFLGWAETEAGPVKHANGAKVKDLAAKGGTKHLYARWQANAYTVRLEKNDGSGATCEQQFVYGQGQRLLYLDAQLKWTRPGWTFLGWSKSKTGAVCFANGEKVENLVAVQGAVVRLYAQWKKQTYTVRFHFNNGGTDTTKTQAVGCTDSQALLWKESQLGWANPAGKTFLGWGTAANATVAKYANGEKVKDLTTVGKTVDLYAVWYDAKTDYVVMYRCNLPGGETVTVSQWMRCNKVNNLVPCMATPPAGKRFAGWACSNGRRYDDGMLVFDLAKPGETVTMTAIWE